MRAFFLIWVEFGGNACFVFDESVLSPVRLGLPAGSVVGHLSEYNQVGVKNAFLPSAVRLHFKEQWTRSPSFENFSWIVGCRRLTADAILWGRVSHGISSISLLERYSIWSINFWCSSNRNSYCRHVAYGYPWLLISSYYSNFQIHGFRNIQMLSNAHFSDFWPLFPKIMNSIFTCWITFVSLTPST